MIQQRQAVQEMETVRGSSDDYLEEVRNDHLGLVGGSAAMVALRDLIRRVAMSGLPVLISGPTGSGKSLVAEAIHRLRARDQAQTGERAGTLARVNCSEVDEKSLEMLLYGTDRQPGLLGGDARTLVLDDVDALPEAMQAKLVRLLQTGSFRAIGSAVERRCSLRILAMTSRSLSRCVRDNTFRADLLYELGVLTVQVPGLDEHREDIPALVNHFLRLGSNPLRFSLDALDHLGTRSWPGSVRELRNLVERAVLQASDNIVGIDVVRPLCAPEAIEGAIQDSLASLAGRLLGLPIRNKLAAVEAALLESAMRASKGNKSAAARILGLHRKAVERKLEKYELKAVPQIGVSPASAITTRVEAVEPQNVNARPPRDRDVGPRRPVESLHLQT